MSTTSRLDPAGPPPRLCLIGLRGSGKSTLGRRLAQATRGAFIDLDHSTCRRLGVASISEAFETVGEERFRAAEIEALDECSGSTGPGTVLALGGGTPCSDRASEKIEALKRSGVVVVWLDAPDAVLADRVSSSSSADRPPLRGSSIEEEVAVLRAERQRIYRRLADLRVDTDAFTLDGAVNAVLAWCGDRRDEA